MNNYEVSIVPCKNYASESVENALSELLTAINGLEWVEDGMTVAIKANLVTFAKPEEAITTHPALICALIRMLKERGAEVIVGDSPGGLYNAAFLGKVYQVCGLQTVRMRAVR